MKLFRKLTFLTAVAFSVLGCDHEQLVHTSSKQMGITAFDLRVTEISRTERFSVLHVTGYETISGGAHNLAASRRWLMCVETVLAAKRKFAYWTASYQEHTGDDIIVGFSHTLDESIAQNAATEFSGKSLMKNVAVNDFIPMCAAIADHPAN